MCIVDRWKLESKKAKSLFAVSWPRKLGEQSCIMLKQTNKQTNLFVQAFARFQDAFQNFTLFFSKLYWLQLLTNNISLNYLMACTSHGDCRQFAFSRCCSFRCQPVRSRACVRSFTTTRPTTTQRIDSEEQG